METNRELGVTENNKVFSQRGNNNKGSVSIHNIFYINKYAKVNEIFKKNGRKYFNTSIEQLDFADSQSAYEALHYWIDDKTNYTTREKDLFEIDDLNYDIKMVSLNAMRFFGKWIAKSIIQTNDTFNLNEKETTMIPFLKIETSYVRYHNFEDLDAVGIELPYEGGEYTMLFLMANEDDGLSHLEKSLTAINLQTLELTEQFPNVIVYVPEFDISTNLDLREPLRKLGLSDLFEDDACLRGIAPKIKLEFMKQTTTLGVDETGTQVTVATAGNAHKVINYRNKKKEKKMNFKIDRPFVFMIREIQTLGPLFIGRYTGFKDEVLETIELF
ncbi:unnamed protein product [Timema podura]|uniref:Serpin domain-containing protein n=1 Tax=Timema podura TaxID=61482 RepID=A0ABN7NEW6_TIMPD|nr:unnamed protein product [Timema podura]